ncbi:MAG: hypothetical protein Q8S84_08100 [bacterium]|nr:hypothetical protein [bacterium]MDP3381398.1 hypothetical protein [bacterium]
MFDFSQLSKIGKCHIASLTVISFCLFGKFSSFHTFLLDINTNALFLTCGVQ